MRTPLVLAACSAFAGCGPSAPPSQAPLGPPADGTGHPLTQAVLDAHARMHARFHATYRIHAAIAASDLEGARRAAQQIVELEEPEALPVWRPYLEQTRAAARQVVAAADPAAAATRLADLGRTCASCHEAMRIKIAFPSDPPPDADPELRATMASHHWAASRMWEGLLAPSVERWREGARVLEAAPLPITAEIDQPPHGLGIADDVARLRLLARRAQDAVDLEARATLYGELLGTCVSCHAVIRDR